MRIIIEIDDKGVGASKEGVTVLSGESLQAPGASPQPLGQALSGQDLEAVDAGAAAPLADLGEDTTLADLNQHEADAAGAAPMIEMTPDGTASAVVETLPDELSAGAAFEE